ncbi:Long-chain fatty acid transport protein 4 [Orchesella cincta]|uniref:Long-chain-fatty-acid--CoA ligase n=1 Tax=Orchesella cincta TaxID=48709 RepID=A0A1D2MJR0_ORCCI|nr:Long-chain fatty acid transport protein 4 [Orchesella cincta]
MLDYCTPSTTQDVSLPGWERKATKHLAPAQLNDHRAFRNCKFALIRDESRRWTQNRPVSYIGAVTVCINTNLRGDSLEECISVVKCKALIIGTELRQAFQDIWDSSRNAKESLDCDIYELDRFLETPGWIPNNSLVKNEALPTLDLAQSLLKAGKEPTVVPYGQEPNFIDPVLYLFTSGTTGAPKAVLCSHGRLLFISSIASALKLSPKDVSYSAVPMYHMVGLFGAVWSLCYGTPVVIVVKFSATNFWKDIHRFLCNQPVQPPELERNHTLRAFDREVV